MRYLLFLTQPRKVVKVAAVVDGLSLEPEAPRCIMLSTSAFPRSLITMNRKPDPYGRDAIRPFQIPLKGWWQVAQRVWSESNRDNLSVVAAGCAFFALFAIFPALSAADLSLWSDCGSRYCGATIPHAWFRATRPSL